MAMMVANAEVGMLEEAATTVVMRVAVAAASMEARAGMEEVASAQH